MVLVTTAPDVNVRGRSIVVAEPVLDTGSGSEPEPPSRDAEVQLMAQICHLYYEEHLTQQQIASRFNLTRWKVGRLVAQAHTEGIVEIKINHPTARLRSLEAELAAAFGLAGTVVVRAAGPDAPVGYVATAAADHLLNLRPRPRILGVAWGRTMSAVADHLPADWARDMTVVQINGSASRTSAESLGDDLALRIARRSEAGALLLPVPTIVSDASIRSSLESDAAIGTALSTGRAADTLIFSLGVTSPGCALVVSGHLKPADVQRLTSLGAVGDLNSRFIDAHGQLVDHELDGRTLGLEIADLQQIHRSIAVSAGAEKNQITLAGLRSGAFKIGRAHV